MSALMLYGKPCADAIYDKVRLELDGENCRLYTIGFDNPAWRQYSESLVRSAKKCGVVCEENFVDTCTAPDTFASMVHVLCQQPYASGVIVQQPLPREYANTLNFVDVNKDIDCLNPLSVAKLYKGEKGLYPATPMAVIRLLDYYGIDLQGKHVVIVGRGNAVGKPLALLALHRNATVTICHTKTVDLPSICKTADVLISACGVANLITKDFVNSRAVVVDVGLSFVDGKTCGDVASEVYDVVSAVSPVPGGVGPVTRATLLENLCKAVQFQK